MSNDDPIEGPDRAVVLERAAAVLRATLAGDPTAAHAELADLSPPQLRGVVLVLASSFASALPLLDDATAGVLAAFEEHTAAAAADEVDRALDELDLR